MKAITAALALLAATAAALPRRSADADTDIVIPVPSVTVPTASRPTAKPTEIKTHSILDGAAGEVPPSIAVEACVMPHGCRGPSTTTTVATTYETHTFVRPIMPPQTYIQTGAVATTTYTIVGTSTLPQAISTTTAQPTITTLNIADRAAGEAPPAESTAADFEVCVMPNRCGPPIGEKTTRPNSIAVTVPTERVWRTQYF
ncbi:hypothetical protein diail_2233 [Diaporthe ilicicola]|nr:hypothetical protein diail_2233 [Diaporthe ilicicola]